MNNKWIPETRDPNTPKYLTLVTSIENAITSGALRPGEKLPSNREISEEFGVTVATVSRAMGEAARRGLVEARVGSGTFVCNAFDATPQHENAVADLSLNTLPTSVVNGALAKAMSRLASETLQESLFSYRSYVPSHHHRQLATQWLAASSPSAVPSRMLCTAGVHQGLLAAFKTLLRPGDRAVCEALTYTGIKRIAEYANVELVAAQCDDNGVIPESVDEVLKRTKAKVVVLTPTMHNPTTATLSLARREALVKIVRAHDAMLIEDGVNVPLANDGLPTLTSLMPDRSLYLTGLSKCVASGFRLGYALVPDVYFNVFHEALVSTQWIGPGVYATLAESILADGSLAECIELHRKESLARARLARKFIPAVRETESVGYHVWVPVATVGQVNDFCTRALQAGVRVSPGPHFAVAADSTQIGYRISLGTVGARDDLERALRVLASISNVPDTTFATLI
ncbi:aminotransferase class I/II-fold pyridoxal phosphate-dependent enzyme [Pandoraea fibrosis]|uniref:Aminotransferase class I/II-fold pyridoxal phosphate-dependent enzyme n=1 Tax=Pandoraea fibrosis TaxID=1891094 RepID=A0ABX6HVK1_9BURK|nr:PLP-dependent aminotransferase family protein [Pandoraea fibrosis]QHE91513.1 aminotransferase class I/II-fold pyridoxal phosphate-dependent enzyme [Pandoraea fibrosis]QHF14929.1 aminotransferase class I/II-fold pyridoxal phosphate-dependent enzyme [Pandoraea fibrosis]